VEAVRQPQRVQDEGAAAAHAAADGAREELRHRVRVRFTRGGRQHRADPAQDDLSGAVWIPGDGKANPTDLTQSLAKGARMRGASIFEASR